MDILYSSFSKAFDSVSHGILVGKFRKCGLDEWAERWDENWLNGTSQRVVNSVSGYGWSVTSGVPKGQCWPQYCLTSSSMAWMEGQVPPQQGH